MIRKILSYSLSILLTLWIVDLGKKSELVSATDVSNSRTTSDGVNSLVATKAPSAASRSLINSDDETFGNLITVVGTVDGLLHGFDEQNNKRWTTDVGGGPLSSHHSSGNLDYSVVPATDGSLLVHSVEGMRKTSVTARMLVEKAPFTTHDGLIFTSQKNSRVIGVDLGSGRVVHDVLTSGGIMGLGSEEKRTSRQGRGAVFDRDRDRAYAGDSSAGVSYRGAGGRKSHRSPFWLGRTDYTLRAFDQITGTEEFNFTYSELRPLHMAGVPLPQHGEGSGAIGQAEGLEGQIQNRPNTVPLPVPLISTPEGELYFTDSNGQIHRTYALDYPAVSAFSVEDVGTHSGQRAGTGSAVRTQSGYAVQSLRLAYRMPGGDCFEGDVEVMSEDMAATAPGPDSPVQERKRKRKRCLPTPVHRNGGISADGSAIPPQSNLVIVRSLNDGGLYALEMIGGSENSISSSNGPSHGMLPMPFTPDKTVKGVTSSTPLGLLPPPAASLPLSLPSTDGTTEHSADGPRKKREELGDNSLLLKTFERVVKGQGKGQGMGMKSGSVGSISLTPRMGARASVKAVGASEEAQVGVEVTGETADMEEEEVELTRGSLLGNHFVMPRRTGPVKKDLARPSDALVVAPALSLSIFGRKTSSKQLTLPVSEDGDRDGEDGQFRGVGYEDDGRAGQGGSQSFLDYLLADHDQSKKGGRWSSVNSSGGEGGEASEGSSGSGGFKPSSESVPRPHSFFVRITNYLHAVEMLMLRVLILFVAVYASLYYLRAWSIVLPPPFGSVSDSLLSLLERIIVRPELLLRRTKSFMQLDDSPRRSSEGRGEAGAAAEPAPVEEEDTELVEGGFTVRVGSLLLTSDVLGYGSHGTVVLRGSLNGRPVAVKRMLSRFNRAADREVSLLIRSDGHPNVVRYFLRETKNEFVYLALQLCNMSLRDFVAKLHKTKKKRERQSTSDTALQSGRCMIPDEARNALRQVAEGLSHLHSQRIVHRDIKPHNILCALPEEGSAGHPKNAEKEKEKERQSRLSCGAVGSEQDGQTDSSGGISSSGHDTDSTAAMTVTAEDIHNDTNNDLMQLGNYILKISDMGLSKQLDKDDGSFNSMSFSLPYQNGTQTGTGEGFSSSDSASIGSADRDGGSKDRDGGKAAKTEEHNPVGTIGWQAPELMSLRMYPGPNEDEAKDDEDEEGEGEGEAEGEGLSDDEREGEGEGEGEDSIDPLGDLPSASLGSDNGSLSLSLASEIKSVAASVVRVKKADSVGAEVGSGTGALAGAGWGAKTRSLTKRTQKCDIFSSGLVYFYVLIPGCHPFGQWYEREANIMKACMDLSPLNYAPDAQDLICRMLAHDPDSRPSASQVCRHPFFWDSHKRLEFLVSISDRLEQESVISSVVLFLESKAHLIIGQGGWDSRGKALAIDPCLLSDMNKYRKYDTHCVRDLLRVIRNKKHHFHELSSELRAKLKLDLPLGFLAYFENRFPRLLLRAVEVACTFFSEEKDFAICRAIAPMFREEREKEVAVGPAAAPSSAASAVSMPYTVPASASASAPSMNAPISSASPSSSSSVGGSVKASGTAADGSERLREESLDGSASASASDAHPSSIDPLNVVVWHGGALSTSLTCRGWWRKIEQSDSWSSSGAPGGGGGGGGWTSTAKAGRPRPMHLIRASTDLKYRTRLCTHWEQTVTCPMRKKGKCDFAHSALELRVKENRRGRWGQRGAGSSLADPPSEQHLRESGGEDVLGSARSIEKVRAAEGSVSEFERSSSTVKKGKGGQGQGQGQAPSSSSHYNLDQNQGQQQQQFYVQQRRQLHYQYGGEVQSLTMQQQQQQQYYYQSSIPPPPPQPPNHAYPSAPPQNQSQSQQQSAPFSPTQADFPSLYHRGKEPASVSVSSFNSK